MLVPAPLALPFVGWDAMEQEAVDDGHAFVPRLREDWQAGRNRFDRLGEVMLGLRDPDGRILAFGGLNIDPYAGDPAVARLRHVYVSRAERRLGIGRILVLGLIDHARVRFSRVRLRAANEVAGAFYVRLGFDLADDADATHVMEL